jgi:hypothetical protein
MRNRNEQWNGQGQERPSTEGGRRNEQWNGKGPERPSTEGGSRAPRAPSAEAIEGSSRNQASKRLSTAECQSSMCRGLEHLRTAVAEDQRARGLEGRGPERPERRSGREPERQKRPSLGQAICQIWLGLHRPNAEETGVQPHLRKQAPDYSETILEAQKSGNQSNH